MSKSLFHLSGLLRTRVILALIGIAVVCFKPEVGQWVVSLVGMAAGVSAVDAWRCRDGRTDKRDPE